MMIRWLYDSKGDDLILPLSDPDPDPDHDPAEILY